MSNNQKSFKKRLSLSIIFFQLFGFVSFFLQTPLVFAAVHTFTVNTTTDGVDVNPGDGICEINPGSNDCGLRAAFIESNGDLGQNSTVINLPQSIYNISMGFPIINNFNVTILGESKETTYISGLDATQIFVNNGSLSLDNVAIIRGKNIGGCCGVIENNDTLNISNGVFDLNIPENGGLIYNKSGSSLNIDTSIFERTTAATSSGGVIYNEGILTLTNSAFSQNNALNGGAIQIVTNGTAASGIITNSTFTANQATLGSGGAIDVGPGSNLILNQVTMAGNQANTQGGGVFFDSNGGGNVTFHNTIVAQNTHTGNIPDDCSANGGTIISQGVNLVGTTTNANVCIGWSGQDLKNMNPLLGVFQNDPPGITQTMNPLPGSPVVDAAPTATVMTDQRGVSRPQGPAYDIGAYEVSEDLGIAVVEPQATVMPGNTLTYSIIVTNNGLHNMSNVSISDNAPSDLQSPLWTCVGNGGSSCNVSGPVAGMISNAMINIVAGQTVTFTLTATVSSAAVNNIIYTATLTPAYNYSDRVIDNNSATDVDTIQVPIVPLPQPTSGGGGSGGGGGGNGNVLSTPEPPTPTPPPPIVTEPTPISEPEPSPPPVSPPVVEPQPVPAPLPTPQNPPPSPVSVGTKQTGNTGGNLPVKPADNNNGTGLLPEEFSSQEIPTKVAAPVTPTNPENNVIPQPPIVVPEKWLNQYGVKDNGGSEDTDRDGVSNVLEFKYGTNPKDADTDHDGYADGVEIFDLGSDPLDPRDPGNLKDLKIKIVSPADNQLISDTAPFIRGVAAPNTKLTIFIKNSAGFEKALGETVAEGNGVFTFITPYALRDGKYILTAKSSSKESDPNNITIDTTLGVLEPDLKMIDDQEIDSDVLLKNLRIVVENKRPVLLGTTEYGNTVVATWKSVAVTSAIVADTNAGEFKLAAPTEMEIGQHDVYVTAIRQKDNAMSKTVKLSFEIGEQTTLFAERGNYVWFIPAAGALLLFSLILYKRRRKKDTDIKKDDQGTLAV